CHAALPYMRKNGGVLVMLVVAIIDLRNTGVKANLGPLLVGFAVAAIGMSFGANAGYAINPARDLGPRLFPWAAGWQELAMPGTLAGSFSGYFWIPIVGPLLGGVIGVLVYDLFIGDVLNLRAQRDAAPEIGRTRLVTAADDE
ncbi:aquaporin, partial [Streptomyces sp. NPDC002814]